MVKIALGVLVGVCGGTALGVFVLSPQSPPATVALSTDNVEQSSSSQEEVSKLKAELLSAEREIESLKRLPEELRADQKHMAAEMHGLRRKLEALESERAEFVEANQPMVGETALTPEEVRSLAAVHLTTLKAGVDAKDKEGVLSALRELRNLGPEAYREFFEAWMLVSDGGKAGSRYGGDNPLGLSWIEARSLLNDEMRDVALANLGGDIPLEAQKAAIGRLVFDQELLTAEKVAKVGEVMSMTTEAVLIKQAVETLDWLNGPESSMYLGQAAGNIGLPTDVRLDAIDALSEEPQYVDMAIVEELERDADPKVAKAGKQLRVVIAPPVSGLLVTDLIDQGQAEKAGILVGDIMLTYNGQKISDMRSLGTAKNTAESGVPVLVEVYRNGARLSFFIEAGLVGIRDGIEVEVKD